MQMGYLVFPAIYYGPLTLRTIAVVDVIIDCVTLNSEAGR